MKPLAIVSTGLMTGVGLDAPSSCAAVRAVIDRFEETCFMDTNGQWIVGSEVHLTPRVRGREKLLRMAIAPINECLTHAPHVRPESISLLLCLSESHRAGRLAGLDETLLTDVQSFLGISFHASSAVIAEGRVGAARAIAQARALIDGGSKAVIVCGVDSLLVAATIRYYEERRRLQTSANSNGFIPGEAGAAVMLVDCENSPDAFACLGVGFGHEMATIDSEEPLQANGLAQACRAALGDANCGFEDVDFRICDANGEQYVFKEAALGLTRIMRVRKAEFDIWHPADCIGEVGAATAPCCIAVAKAAIEKDYAPGPGVLAHFGNDRGQRAALILRRSTKGTA